MTPTTPKPSPNGDLVARPAEVSPEELAEALHHSAPDAPLIDRLKHPPSRYNPVQLRLEARDALIVRDVRIAELEAALTEASATLVQVKQEWWREASAHWIMADFLNWATVQRITAAVAGSRTALTPAQTEGGEA